MTTSHERSFQKLAAGAAILSVPLAYVSIYLGLVAVNFDPKAFSDPGSVISVGMQSVPLVRWSWVLDIFGYYLLLAPAVVVFWYWLRWKNEPMVALLTLGGLTYVLLGALGAAINAVIWPDFIAAYVQAGPEGQAALEPVFAAFATTVFIGMWGILGRVVSAVWWLGIGLMLRDERRWLAYGTILLGLFALVAAVGNSLRADLLIGLGTMGYLLLAPLWALWLGLDLLRRPAGLAAAETTESTPPGFEVAE